VIFHLDRFLEETHLRPRRLNDPWRVRVLPALFPRVTRGGGKTKGTVARWKGTGNLAEEKRMRMEIEVEQRGKILGMQLLSFMT